MILRVAATLKGIMESWRLVYHQYVASSLIEVNPFGIFTFPQYLQRDSAVILGTSKATGDPVCSISGVLDSDLGLPLDTYFKGELDELRKDNRKLIEIGLLANTRKTASPFYTIELLTSIAKFGVYSNHHDYVIGVHPRRAEFFKKLFGFEILSNTKIYHKLQKAEVVLLYADANHFETQSKEASHIVYHEERPLDFNNRFRFNKLAHTAYKAGDYFLTFIKKFDKKFIAPQTYPHYYTTNYFELQ
jgi:hypothetical protein